MCVCVIVATVSTIHLALDEVPSVGDRKVGGKVTGELNRWLAFFKFIALRVYCHWIEKGVVVVVVFFLQPFFGSDAIMRVLLVHPCRAEGKWRYFPW